MLEIFTVEEGIVKPTTEVLLISPFKDIWESDKTSKKEKAYNEFSFIEFVVSPKKTNPYKDYDEETRRNKLKEKFNVSPDNKIEEAITLYKTFVYEASFSYQFLEAAKEGALSIKEFLLNSKEELKARTRTGGMVIKPGEITRALKDTEEVLKNLQNLEKKVHEELQKSKTVANREINYFET